ncbi:TSUP family transporter [Pseudomonas sp. LPB0260]|uniref:sulfite exporter TauE/SafE family protein n=1 Tax=Pseudomonas sp. LPB0260 TaxID=2614442 RepID=UPI0015C20F9B|nr:TSUP family transporter [Pseudomonas sp. LPB0260]QLC72653.1 TSUP family transporter [Pseudomonas sp. LPB0260]QLC75427.1 TSUP family transporter [Pseudomonas sp. LPB0260]
MELMLPDMALGWLAVLVLGALLAGYLDAIAGGGGIIQVPILLLSGMPPVNVLATNKAVALMGTASAAVRYMLGGQVVWRIVRVAALPCLLAACLGSHLAMLTPDWLLELCILGCLIVALLAALLVRTDTRGGGPPPSSARIICNLMPVGLYDGFSGPGTGVFLVLVKHARLKLEMLAATATTKPINLLTNVGGVAAFIWAGKVVWAVAVPMILANALGGWLGSRAAIRRGAAYIRRMLLVMLVMLCGATLWKLANAWF